MKRILKKLVLNKEQLKVIAGRGDGAGNQKGTRANTPDCSTAVGAGNCQMSKDVVCTFI